jgi:hypothetical protein
MSFREKDLSGGRENGTAALATEESNPNLTFQIRYLFTNGGLRDIEHTRSVAKAALLCSGGEVFEVAKFHILMLSVFPILETGLNCTTLTGDVNQYQHGVVAALV